MIHPLARRPHLCHRSPLVSCAARLGSSVHLGQVHT
jgi:hypothetical protein